MNMNKLKYVTLNAVLILGLLPVASTVTAVNTAHAAENEVSTKAGSSDADVLNDKLKVNSSVSVVDLKPVAAGLADIVNQQANEGLINNYSAPAVDVTKKSALEELYKVILKDSTTATTFKISDLSSHFTGAQLVINGKTSITAEEIKTASSLVIEFKLFSLGNPDPAFSQAVSVTVNQFSVTAPDLNKNIADTYTAAENLVVKDPDGVVVANPTIKIAGTSTVISGTVVPQYLIDASLTNVAGAFINEGIYEETLDIYDAAGTELLKAGVTRSVIVGIGKYQPSFVINGTGTKYNSGSIVTSTNHYLPEIVADLTEQEDLESTIMASVTAKIKASDMNAANSTAPTDYSVALDDDNTTIDISAVDLSKAGTYSVLVTYKKAGSNISSTITVPVKVKGLTAPIILFTNGQNLTVKVGESFNMKNDFQVFANSSVGVTGQGKNVTWKIVGEVDTNKVGVYTLRYIATNTKGLSTELTRIITVVENPGDGPLIEDLNTVGYVSYVPGYGIRVWSAPAGEGTEQLLGHGSAWRIDQKATLKDGSIWYRVGTNQWVDGKYISLTPLVSGNEEQVNGIATINYVPGYSVNVYSAPEASSANWTNKQLKHGTKWQAFKKATVNGKTFYNLGGDQWVDGQYVTFSAN